VTALLLALAFFFSDPDCRSCDLLEHVAAALSEGDGAKFMEFLDRSTPGYEDIATNVNALTNQQGIAASIDVLQETGDDQKTVALADWYMEFTSKDALEHITRRRMRVHITMARKEKGRWKVTEIDPRTILDPVTTPQP
jgi:hypothetical protein